MLSIYYHILLINLFEPFMQMGYIHAEADPTTIVNQSKACFETLLRVYYLRHGFEALDISLVQFLHLLGFSALRDISLAEKGSTTYEALRSTLLLCAKGMQEQGQNYHVSEVVFRLFRYSMSLDDAQLLKEVIETEEYDDHLDHMIGEIRSLWPIGMFSMVDENVDRTLNHFIRWWERYIQTHTQDNSMAIDLASPNATSPRYPLRYRAEGSGVSLCGNLE